MSETERVINDLNTAKLILCNPQTLTPEMCIKIGQTITSSIALLKEQEAVVRCKDCKNKEKDGISEGFHYCNINGLQVTDDWYCADGKRRDDHDE